MLPRRIAYARPQPGPGMLLPTLLLLLALLVGWPPAPAGAQEQAPDPFAEAGGGTGGESAAGDPFGSGGSGDDPFAEAFGGGGSGGDPFAAAGGFGGAGEEAGRLELLGFIQVEQAHHVGDDGVNTRDIVLNNVRARLKTSLQGDSSKAYLKVDFLLDEVRNTSEVDLREARVLWTPITWLDVSAGVQVSTWGVGDMVFINDLFPKNWVANFTGQDLEFLKEPANSLRTSVYAGPLTWDVVYTPEFSPDVTPTGCRFAVFDPMQGTRVANPDACENPPQLRPLDRGQSRDGEVATRFMTRAGPIQLALYGYRGFWKSPRGLLWIDPETGAPVLGMPDPNTHSLMPFHPRLEAYGVSAEGQLGPGIVALEGGYYDSLEDPEGTDPLIENSVTKGLLGYRMDFTASFSAGVQVMTEVMDDYEAYRENLLPDSPVEPAEEQRDTYTLRLTYKAQQDTLLLHFFGYHRPDDRDGFYKTWFAKRVDNNLEVAAGANVFAGAEGFENRDFGMLADDDNAFLRFTYNF